MSKLMDGIKESLEEQLNTGNPACTQQAYQQLIEMGYEMKEAKDILITVLTEEVMEMMTDCRPYNEAKYADRLKSTIKTMRTKNIS